MQNLDDDGAIALTNKALELLNNRSMSFLHTLHGVRMMLKTCTAIGAVRSSGARDGEIIVE